MQRCITKRLTHANSLKMKAKKASHCFNNFQLKSSMTNWSSSNSINYSIIQTKHIASWNSEFEICVLNTN